MKTPTEHTVRTRDGGVWAIKPYYRSTAIKTFCTECLGWDIHPSKCTDPHCPLYPYRGQTLKTQRGEG